MENNQEKVNISEKESLASASVLIEPWITEAATAGLGLNKYVFKVDSKADKIQVKKAVEELYKVKVISVNTIKVHKKFRSYGKTPGWKAGFKKAVVTLKEGDKIELFKEK